MKTSVKKIIAKVSHSLPRVKSTGTNVNDMVPGTTAMHLPWAKSSVLAEYYEALLWMNDSTKQLEELIDWLV